MKDDNSLQAFIQQAKENIDDGSWLTWDEALKYKEGDVVILSDTEDGEHYDKKQSIKISDIYTRKNNVGLIEKCISGRIIEGLNKGAAMGGVLAVYLPENNTSITNITTLYQDENVTFDTYKDKYRISFFKDCHWAGEIVINKSGEIYYSSFTDTSC